MTVLQAAPTMEEAIEQLISLGFGDPVVIADKLDEMHGEEWAIAQLAAHRHDIFAEIARKKLGSVRRSAELALRPGDQMASAEMKIAKTWVPGKGWHPVADLTAEDLAAKAAWYRSLASAATRRAVWCDEVIALMESEGVKTIGRLKAALPPLPDAEGLAICG